MNKVKDKRISKAYSDGYVDYDTFGENVPNPYEQGTEESKCWEAGYSYARSLQAMDEQDSWYA